VLHDAQVDLNDLEMIDDRTRYHGVSVADLPSAQLLCAPHPAT
jgi:hypothetical protein